MSYSRIKAKHIQSGMWLRLEQVYYIDEVEWTKDGKVLVRLGMDGSETMFFEMNEILFISNGN
jgi:hypothetical protein